MTCFTVGVSHLLHADRRTLCQNIARGKVVAEGGETEWPKAMKGVGSGVRCVPVPKNIRFLHEKVHFGLLVVKCSLK